MNKGLDLIKAADDERSLVPALLDEQIGVSKHTAPSERALKNYGTDANVTKLISKSQIYGLIIEQADFIDTERTEGKV